MKRLLVIGAGLAAVGAVAAVAVVRDTGGGSSAGAAAPARKTAVAQRKDVVRTASYDGTTAVHELGQLKAARPGTVTWLPAAGTTIRPGEVLYRINEQPTYLMSGDIPMFRDLDIGVADGGDVKQLETDLLSLGFGGTALTEADTHFDAATRQSVRAWQTATAQTVTGRINKGDIVFASSAVVIGDYQAKVGDDVGPSAPVAKLIDQYVEVTVTAKSTDRDELAVGKTVTVGRDTPARTATVRSQKSDAGGNITVVLDLKDPLPFTRAGESLKVTVELERHDHVVTVPVTALLALVEGGYAVEVVDGDATHLVPVMLGLFANGVVEVSGIDAGTTVVVSA